MKIAINDKSFVFRGQTSGVAGKVFQARGIALPPVLRSC
jgi:ribosomal protein L24